MGRGRGRVMILGLGWVKSQWSRLGLDLVSLESLRKLFGRLGEGRRLLMCLEGCRRGLEVRGEALAERWR